MNDILIKRMKKRVLLYQERAERDKWIAPLADYLGLSKHTIHNWVWGSRIVTIPNKHTHKIRDAINRGII